MRFDVDKAFCISIHDRIDRQNQARINLQAISDTTEFWLVQKDKENPERGCYNSHRDIALYGIENNLERIMIFEDDVLFHRSPREWEIDRFNKHLASGQGDIFYLGALLGNIWLTRHFGIVGCEVFCTHSYVINRNGMKKLADAPYSGLPIDVLYRNHFESYMAFPMITSQASCNTSHSDISSTRNSQTDFSDDVWKRNRRSQYLSIFRNIHRTIC